MREKGQRFSFFSDPSFSGELIADRGVEVVASSPRRGTAKLPESIRSMIARKIDQLDGTERKILLAASVQGEEFDAAVIARALDTDPIELFGGEGHTHPHSGIASLPSRAVSEEFVTGCYATDGGV